MSTRRALPVAVLVAATLTIGVTAQQSPDRSKPPASGAVPVLQLPAVQKARLSNGLPVWIVEMHQVPVAQVSLVVFSGSASDPAGKYGAASLTASMMTNGAGSRSALEIDDAVDYLGAELGAASGIDSSAVRLHVPVTRLADALSVMADVALRPTFPADELERVRRQRLTGLLQARDDPASLNSLAFSRVLFGTAHRYGTAAGGTAETIKAMTADDLKAFYTAAFRPDNAALLVVGDVTVAGVTPLLEAQFGTWKAQGTALAAPKLPTPPARTAREVYLIDKPDAAQSQIRIGLVGVPRSTPDFFPIEVMNTVLGGAFTSRLNNNLREKHGYTYGAGSGFDMRVGAGPFVATAGVQTDKTAEALKEFFIELNGIQQPIPAEELAKARNNIALRFPGGFEATGDVSRRLEEILVYHLPEDYFSKYVQNITAVTQADALRVAKAYVQTSKVAVVIVGDLKKIEAPVRALNLGPVKVLTVNDVFGPPPVM